MHINSITNFTRPQQFFKNDSYRAKYFHIDLHTKPKFERNKGRMIYDQEKILKALKNYDSSSLSLNLLSQNGFCEHYSDMRDLQQVISSYTIMNYLNGISNKVTLGNITYTIMSNEEAIDNIGEIIMFREVGK